MPEPKTILSHTFFRKLGKSNLLKYLKHKNHELLSTIEALSDEENSSADISNKLIELFTSEETNSSRPDDVINFQDIKEICSEQGKILLANLLPKTEFSTLLQGENLHDYDIAMQLFTEAPRFFGEILLELEVH